MDALAAYGEDDSNDEGSQSPKNFSSENVFHPSKEVTVDSMKSKFNLNSAPAVIPKVDGDNKYLVAPGSKETQFNVKYDELFAPSFGPENPFKTKQQKAVKNMLSGLAEPAHFSDFQFDNQRKTFHSYGYALDPSTASGDVQGERFVGDVSRAEEGKGVTVFEGIKPRAGDRRKREKPGDPGDLDGYKGPWASFVDEEKVSKPSEEQQAILEEYDAVKQKRNKKEDEKIEEKTKLHVDDAYDYQGRSFLHIPQDLDVDLKCPDPPEKCFLPKKRIHTWSGHSKGVSCVRLFPVSGHLMLSASMDCKIKIWEVYNKRRNIRTYTGHSKAVRDVCFNNDGTKFLSCGYDRWIKLWDTETGECIGRFSNKKIPYCVKFNPDEDKQHLFIAGMADKKMITWDSRENEIVQEYDRHLGAVNTITFVDQNRRIVTTSDDKSIRIWEWDIPVDSKYIADPGMHSMPSCTLSPNGKWLACQSMDNQIKIYGVLNKFRENRKKVFKGHMNAGYACQVDFSPDMAYLISGDADGKLNIWDWKTTKLFCKFKAHDEVCIGCVWLPHETSKIITCGWDGLIKLWD